jgi:hypothetical protein
MTKAGDMTDFTEDVPDQSEQLDLQPEEMLLDTGVDDVLDGGYELPDHYSPGQGFGNTPAEMAEGETLDQRLEQEVPDLSEEDLPTSPAADGVTENLDDLLTENLDDGRPVDAEDVPGDNGVVGDDQVIGLVDPEEGLSTAVPGTPSEDDVPELVGEELGGSTDLSAEEAAVHTVDQP